MEQIKQYIIKEFMFETPQAELADDQPLLVDGIIDSLGIFTLIAFIEKEFGIKIAPEDVVLDNFESVHAISNLVQSRQALNGQSV